MPRKKIAETKFTAPHERPAVRERSFHLEFLNAAQKQAWVAFQEHDILILDGPAGTGKTHLAVAFAANEVLAKRKKKIVITRPIVEAGESLGFLPGTLDEKVHPYMIPIFDSLTKLVGNQSTAQRELLNHSIEIAPLAYMRGRTFDDAICIFDEAQNATYAQLKLFLTRFGKNSKVILTGDLNQSDLPGKVALVEVIDRIKTIPGVGMVDFQNESIIRHPLIGKLLEKL